MASGRPPHPGPRPVDLDFPFGEATRAAAAARRLAEEVRHVEIGSYWFRVCCDHRGLDPETVFLELLKAYFGQSIRGPFNIPARMQAGFTQREMDAISGLQD